MSAHKLTEDADKDGKPEVVRVVRSYDMRTIFLGVTDSWSDNALARLTPTEARAVAADLVAYAKEIDNV